MNSQNDDVLYYNLTISSANKDTIGILYQNDFLEAKATINNNIPIINNPNEYYCSIIRKEFTGYSIPLIQYQVQTPVSDINKGIYSFTLTYGASSSSQTFYAYIAQDATKRAPLPGTLTQDYTNGYYNIYDYTWIVKIMNVALNTAFVQLQGIVGAPLAVAVTPFFYYNKNTQKMELYAEKLYFDKDLATPIKIYFNSPSYVYFTGFPTETENINSSTGKDNFFCINTFNTLNDVVLNAITYIKEQQQYISLMYMSSLKSILVTTTMNIRPEANNISLQVGSQNVGFQNIMTDFLPDLAQPIAGLSSYKFIYNSASLYRIFEFYQTSPLYTINASLSYLDIYGNLFPLSLPKGQVVDIKFMFIKKTAFKQSLLNF